MQRRIHVFFSGTVQGVGFRFTTQGIARDLAVAGWVKNLYDGRVESVAEGEQLVLKDFLSRIEKYFKNYISNVDIQWKDPTGEFSDFRISY